MVDFNAADGKARDVVLLVTEDRWLLRTLAASLHASTYSVIDALSATDAHRAHTEHGPGALAFVDTALDETEPGALVGLVGAFRRGGWAHILTVGGRPGPDRVVAALAAGAGGHLVAGDPIHCAAAQPAVRDRRITASQPWAMTEFSAREVQVITLAARGYRNREIGHVLEMNVDSVKSCLSRMNRNTGARDRAHLVLLTMRSGAIT